MIELLEDYDLTDFTVIFPSVCIGNIGQFAADLIIYNLKLVKLGYVWHPDVLTLAGADPFVRTNTLSTGCEIFFSPSLKIVVFQVRSAFSKKSSFVEDLCNWLKKIKAKQLIILTGSSGHERKDKQLSGESLRYVFCPLTKREEGDNADSRNWIELEKKENYQSSNSVIPSVIPGSGITVKLFEQCMKQNIQCSILLNFCSEGDNIPDALKLAEYLNQWLQLKEKQKINNWMLPPSWSLVFGSLPPYEIFN